jgi:hypothetical protein
MKRILSITTLITLIVLSGFAVRRYWQTEMRRGLDLAGFMPGGALAYVEVRDLKGLLGRWLGSGAHQRYFESANWTEVQRSRLYLKVRERLVPLETALGFEINEQEIENLAGGRSALGVYNIGELEAVFITEMTQQQALVSSLFKQRRAFRQQSADGLLYYVREGQDEEGRRKVQGVFAFAQGKLLVASSETLMRRALANVRRKTDDQLSPQIASMTGSLSDFTPHEITIWLDHRRLNNDRYFKNYWLPGNLQELREFETALIDLELGDASWSERRWFALGQAAAERRQAIGSLNDLLRFVPAGTQLLAVTAPEETKTVSRTIANVLLGPVPPETLPAGGGAESTYEDSQGPSATGSYTRYVSLDERFNRDIDDPTSYVGQSPGGTSPPEAVATTDDALVTRLADALEPTQPADAMRLGEAQVGENRLFVQFHRALVIKLARPAAFKRGEFEQAVRQEFTARYVVKGVPDRLEWQTRGEIRTLSQAMLDHGGAYAIAGEYLVLANRAEYCDRVLQAYKRSVAPTQSQNASLSRYAQVRIQQGTEAYRHVMDMLAVPRTTGDSNQPIDLFRDNIGGLFGVVPELSRMTIETASTAPLAREVVVYAFEGPRTRP